MLVSFSAMLGAFTCIMPFNPQDNYKRGTIIIPILQKVKLNLGELKH